MLNENIKICASQGTFSGGTGRETERGPADRVQVGENGLSVPDADMLIAPFSGAGHPRQYPAGQTLAPAESDDLKAISEKLEVINLQLARKKTAERRFLEDC